MATTAPSVEAAPVRRRPSVPPLVSLGLPVIVLGGLAMLHVVGLARLSELEYEKQRWEGLCQEQAAIHDDLLQARAGLINSPALGQYVARKQLVPAPEARPLRLGSLPAYQVYWKLPDEATPAPVTASAPGSNGTLVGLQAPLAAGPSAQGL